MPDIKEIATAAGFKYADHLIHAFVGGSELHGAKVKGTDDKDWYGLYIEPAEAVLGFSPEEHFVWSTAGQYERNGPQDIDITFYGLRKWASMAAKGNPTALHFLFAPNVLTEAHGGTSEWEELIAPNVKKFVIAKSAAKQFKGFADAQLGRLLGTRGRGKKGQRPELEEKFGYDVKAGMHTVRLLNECIELMNYGKITLPRPERDLLIEIRTGQWSLDKLSTAVNILFAELAVFEKRTLLREKPDKQALEYLVINRYLNHWRTL